jgi:hypothetical protein
MYFYWFFGTGSQYGFSSISRYLENTIIHRCVTHGYDFNGLSDLVFYLLVVLAIEDIYFMYRMVYDRILNGVSR